MRRREWIKGTLGLGAVAALYAHESWAVDVPSDLVRDENQKAGTRDWMLKNTRIDPDTKYRCPWIEGYCAHTSIRAGESLTRQEPSETKVQETIGVSLITLHNPFFKVIGNNITSEGKKHGYETIVVSGEKDMARQGNQVRDFIVRKVSAIVWEHSFSSLTIRFVKSEGICWSLGLG